MAKIPDKVGKYKILSQIGKGGMGVVYAARHPTLKSKVILKKLTIRDKEFRERFRLEARMMMDLRSDYIVDMYDHFREGGSWYIAMEYIEGISLEELICREGPLDLPLFLYIMRCLSGALEYIHGKGIVHRDIKPSNIYLSRSGDVKLGDFGIASSPERNVRITDSGSAMGTPAYMAPEQFDDSSAVGREADLFSFGVTMYEALTGRKPFLSDSYTALKAEVCRGRFKRPSLLRKEIPFHIKWMIRRCLYVKPRFRPSGLTPFRKRLERELSKKVNSGVKERLALMVDGREKKRGPALLTEAVAKKRKPSAKHCILTAGAVASAALAILLLFFFRLSYGAVEMRVLPADQSSSFQIYPYGASDGKSGRFNSRGERKVYLKEGSYTVIIESRSSLFRRSFYISPISEKKEPVELTVLSSPLEQKSLYFDLTVKDRFSGKDLTGSASVFIRKGDHWVGLSETIREDLKTGSSYEFKVEREGYADEICTLTAQYHQTTADLDILMTPRSATLTVPPSADGRLTVNGSSDYFSLETLKFESLKRTAGQPLVLRLMPGEYELLLTGEEGTIARKLSLKGGVEYNFP